MPDSEEDLAEGDGCGASDGGGLAGTETSGELGLFRPVPSSPHFWCGRPCHDMRPNSFYGGFFGMSAFMNLPHHGGPGQVVPFPVHGASRGHLPDWHGPAGGHDQIWYSESPLGQPDTGHGSRHMAVEPGVRWVYYDIYDVLDYLAFQTGAPAEAALRTLQELSAAALGRTIGLILMVTQAAVLCAQVFWSRPLAGGRAQVRKPGWANILLGFAFLLVKGQARATALASSPSTK